LVETASSLFFERNMATYGARSTSLIPRDGHSDPPKARPESLRCVAKHFPDAVPIGPLVPDPAAVCRRSDAHTHVSQANCPRVTRWAIKRATAARHEWSALKTWPKKTHKVTSGE
jgi:hypothetical protein